MTLILVAILAQTGAPEATIDDRIAAFLRGDAGAREALVKAGAPAIAPLRKSRAQAPDKVDALVLEIKTAVAFPKDKETAEKLGALVNLDLDNATARTALKFFEAISGVQIVDATGGKPDLTSITVTLKAAATPAWAALNAIGATSGVDYGFFHGVVVIATPEQLWGTGKKAGAFGPSALERQRLSPEDEKLKKQLDAFKVDLDFQNQTVADALTYLKEFCGVKMEFEAAAMKGSCDLSVKSMNFFNTLALITQIGDLDFILKDGKLFVATREEIEKKIADKK